MLFLVNVEDYKSNLLLLRLSIAVDFSFLVTLLLLVSWTSAGFYSSYNWQNFSSFSLILQNEIWVRLVFYLIYLIFVFLLRYFWHSMSLLLSSRALIIIFDVIKFKRITLLYLFRSQVLPLSSIRIPKDFNKRGLLEVPLSKIR